MRLVLPAMTAAPAFCRRTFFVPPSVVGVFVVFSLNLYMPVSSAAERYWLNPAGGSFETVANWDNGLPGTSDTANFTLNEDYIVTIAESHTNRNLFLQRGDVSLNIGSYGYALSATSSPAIVIGTPGEPATLRLVSGSLYGVEDAIGLIASSNGTAIVTGAGSTWRSSESLSVGGAGTGTLIIEDGGRVASFEGYIARDMNSSGSASVRGVGSTWNMDRNLTVGESGFGSLLVENGGVVTSLGGVIGDTSSGTGLCTVTGGNSAWTINQWPLYVGADGTGTLIVEAGGTVASTDGYVGSNGLAIISGAGSVWNNIFSFDVNGTVTIDDGGSVNGSYSDIGGTVIVRDGSSMSIDSQISVGGSLHVLDGGQVESTWASISAINATLLVSGTGSKLISEYLGVSGHGGSTLDVFDGGEVITGSAQVGGGTGDYELAIANISGAGSIWRINGLLYAGFFGAGAITVSQGGQLISSEAWIGPYDVGAPASTVTISGIGSTWSNAGPIYVNVGVLTVANGGNVTSENGNIWGSAIVTGAGSTWTNTGVVAVDGTGTLTISSGGTVSAASIAIGDYGTGTMIIEDGGGAFSSDGRIGENEDSTGTVLVTGAGSNWFNSFPIVVGGSGTGSLAIEDGGWVYSNAENLIGAGPGSSGAVAVTGVGSTWIIDGVIPLSGELHVGSAGTGTMTISDGGSVSHGPGYIGRFLGSTGVVTVSGTGSTWSMNRGVWEDGGDFYSSGDLFVGAYGTGKLTIADGGRVSNYDGYIGYFSVGAVIVSGADSAWRNDGNLYVGGAEFFRAGPATLSIEPGAMVSVLNTLRVWRDSTVNLNGGTLLTYGIDLTSSEFSSGGEFNWTDGTLHVAYINGDLVQPSGTFAPMGWFYVSDDDVFVSMPGNATINGDYFQSANGTLELEIGGLGTDQHDSLSISGVAFISGSLALTLIDGFIPNAADVLTILDVGGGIIDAFSNATNGTRLTTTDGLGSCLGHYGAGSLCNPQQVVLTDFLLNDVIPGDYDGSGNVDIADFTVWQSAFGSTADLRADGNGDLVVDAADYVLWRKMLSANPAGAGAGSANVPEPSSFPLLLTTALLAVAAFWNRRSRVS
jgi:T5SS/PEP-CTERM-associated repeat protein